MKFYSDKIILLESLRLETGFRLKFQTQLVCSAYWSAKCMVVGKIVNSGENCSRTNNMQIPQERRTTQTIEFSSLHLETDTPIYNMQLYIVATFIFLFFFSFHPFIVLVFYCFQIVPLVSIISDFVVLRLPDIVGSVN